MYFLFSAENDNVEMIYLKTWKYVRWIWFTLTGPTTEIVSRIFRLDVRQWFIKKWFYWSSNAFKQNNLRYYNLFCCDALYFILFLKDALIFIDSFYKKKN